MVSAIYWQYSQAMPWVLVLLVVAGASVVWLYPPQLRQVPRPARWLMPSLRLIAVSAIIVSILRPVISRPRQQAERGPVLVLIDHSRSTGVVDVNRPLGQWVAVAAALGRLPAGVRNPDYQNLQRDCEQLSSAVENVVRARAERDYAKLSGNAVEAAVARLEQNTRDVTSLARDAGEHAARLPRAAALQRTLAYLSGAPAGVDAESWLDPLTERARTAVFQAEQARTAEDAELFQNQPEVQDACAPLQSMSRLALAEAVVTDPAAGLVHRLDPRIPLKAFGVGDRVTPIIIDDLGGPDRPSTLEPDGNRTDLLSGIRAALARGADTPARAVVLFSDGRQINADPTNGINTAAVPIFCVSTAARLSFKDVSITDATVPATAFVGEPVVVRAVVRAVGFNGSSTEVALLRGNDRFTQRVTFPDDRPVVVEFRLTFDQGGPQRLWIEAGGLPGEISVENNRVDRWIKIFDHPLRIGIAGVPGQDPEIARRSLAQARWASPVELAVGNSGKIDWSPAQIARFDVLLLTGTRASGFGPDQWDAVSKLVTDQGGSVILVPGDGGSFDAKNPTLARLLPFARAGATDWRIWPGIRPGLRVTAAPGFHGLDFADPADSLWQSLAPIWRYVPITPLKQGVRPLLVESESGTPLLTESRQGHGRVFCFGARETWQWRETNAEYPERFWRQLFRYAGGEPYESRNAGVQLDCDPASVEPGRPVRVRVRLTSAGPDPATVKVRFVSDGKTVREITLSSTGPKGAGLFEAVVSDLTEGDYDVQADAGQGKPFTTLHVRTSSEDEMTDLSGDDGWMRRLAESTGGKFLRLDQIDQLPGRLNDMPADPTRPIELRLWDGPYLFSLVVGCLTIEWGLRKRFGLS